MEVEDLRDVFIHHNAMYVVEWFSDNNTYYLHSDRFECGVYIDGNLDV